MKGDKEINALIHRGLRGGLLAGHHLGSDEVHHLCERLDAQAINRKMALEALKVTIEECINGEPIEELAVAHGLLVSLLEDT